MITLLQRIFHSAWLSFRRNGWLSLVSIFIMSQALLILSIFFVFNALSNTAVRAINEKLDLAVYFKEAASEEEILGFKSEIETLPEVREATFISRKEALHRYLAQFKSNQLLVDIIGQDENFFPASLEIKVKNPFAIETLVSGFLQGSHGPIIKSTSFSNNQEVVKKLRSAAVFLQRVSLVIGALFLLISLLIIFNAVRVAIFTRREEIEIMKLVGATDWYIRWPFIIEGMIYGLLAVLISTLVIYLIYAFLAQPFMTRYILGGLDTASSNLFRLPFFLQILFFQLAVGLVAGALSSYWATKRYLRI